MDRNDPTGKMLDDLEQAIAGPPPKAPPAIDVTHVQVDVFGVPDHQEATR